MKKLSLLLLLSVFVLGFVGCSSDDDPAVTPTVYQLELPILDANTEYVGDTEDPVEEWEEWGTTYYQTLLTDKSNIFEFDCISSIWGLGAGYEFSNLTSGSYSAVTKKGVNGSTYITSYYDYFNNPDVAIRFKDNIDKTKTKAYTVKGLYVTNAQIAYDVILNGTEGAGETDEFKEGDWFKVTIYNLDKSKKVEYYLADYRNKEEVINEWKWVDLTSLGETSGLKFELTSSDNDPVYGMNTPSYFCLDGITLEEK